MSAEEYTVFILTMETKMLAAALMDSAGVVPIQKARNLPRTLTIACIAPM